MAGWVRGSELVIWMVPLEAGSCKHTAKVTPSLPVIGAVKSLDWSPQPASAFPVAGMRTICRLPDVEAFQVCNYLLILPSLKGTLIGCLPNADANLLELQGWNEGGGGKKTHTVSCRRKPVSFRLHIHLLQMLLNLWLALGIKRAMSVR